jgi:hypothetical protein
MDQEPVNKFSISELCKETFLAKDNAIKIAWIALGAACTIFGTAIVWAMGMSSNVSAMNTKMEYTEKAYQQMQADALIKYNQIDQKLDILIKK